MIAGLRKAGLPVPAEADTSPQRVDSDLRGSRARVRGRLNGTRCSAASSL